jgi:L-asparagine transporter-like permease
MSLYPWNQIGTIGSPFVLTFEKLGIRAAAGIINFVVLTAALSSCNGGIFSTGRMLYNLALQQKAPAVFGQLSARHVPTKGILVSAVFLLIGVVLNYLVPAKVFTYVTSVATFGALWVWAIILVVQMKFRESLNPQQIVELKYPMPHYPFGNWLSLAFLVMVVIIMFFDADTRMALYIAPVWFGLVIASYYMFGLNRDDATVNNSSTGR